MRSISQSGRALFAIATLAVALGLAACDNTPDDTGATTPTTPTVSTTETFSGTINVNGAATHSFLVNWPSSSTVTATLTTITPDGSVAGLSLGTWNGAICQVVLANDNAIQGNVVMGTASSAGTLCVRIQDTGKLTEATDYTITIEHF